MLGDLRDDVPVDVVFDAFELAVVGMGVIDRAGRLRRVNPALASLLGRPVEELIGTTLVSVTCADDVSRSQDMLRELGTKAVDKVRFDERYVRPDGSVVWVDLHVQSLADADGEIVAFLGQAVDITDRKALEAELVRVAEPGSTDAVAVSWGE